MEINVPVSESTLLRVFGVFVCVVALSGMLYLAYMAPFPINIMFYLLLASMIIALLVVLDDKRIIVWRFKK